MYELQVYFDDATQFECKPKDLKQLLSILNSIVVFEINIVGLKFEKL